MLRTWEGRLRGFLPAFLEEHGVLSAFLERASVVLHGSTTMGIDDAFSDLDLWFLVPDSDLVRLDALSETRFFGFEASGKAGHLNTHGKGAFRECADGCDMDVIFQLRRAVVLWDGAGEAEELKRLAAQRMRREVSKAFFFYHYVEMRGEHRACDTPMERGDAVAVVLSLTKAMGHAMRAAMVLEGEPYPYDKWLRCACALTPTGGRVCESIDRIVYHLAADLLRFEGSEAENPISLELRVIRQVLIDAAHEKGIDAPWLAQWWLHMDQARSAIRDIRW